AADVSTDPAAAIAAADARASLISRGSIFAASLDEQIRRDIDHFSGLSEAVRMMIANAVADGRRELPLADFLHQAAWRISVQSPPDAELLAQFEAVVGNAAGPSSQPTATAPAFVHASRGCSASSLDSS